MKNLTTKLMFAAAALFAAGAASAQTMKADIPFAYRAGGKLMAAGVYRVELNGLSGTVLIHDEGWKTTVIAQPVTHIEGKNQTAPELVFACGRETCSLVQAWPGYAKDGLQFKTPKLHRNEEASLTVIHLRPDAAD